MRKIHSLLAAACLLAASCNKEEIQSETDKAGMYHITVAVNRFLTQRQCAYI